MKKTETGELVPLHRTGDLKVARDSTDVRGWEVVMADGRTLGTVRDLLVDTGTMSVRCLIVELGAEWVRAGATHVAQVSMDGTRIDSAGRRVYVYSLTAAEVPRLSADAPPAPPADDPTVLEGVSPAATAPPEPRAEPVPAAAAAAPAPERPVEDEEARVTLAEEELAVSKRTVPAGEVTVGKHVETERVRETVERMREDVTIERRPVPEGLADFRPRVEGDVTYVPLVEEELVIEKRLVAREELVIRKRQVVEREVVEETLRKEVPEVRGADGALRPER